MRGARRGLALAAVAAGALALAWSVIALREGGPPGVPATLGHRLLADGSFVPGPPAAAGPWAVAGRCVDGRFEPMGQVVGGGDLGEAGTAGWLELADGAFCAASEGEPPTPPYVAGFLGADARFSPSRPQVVRAR